MYKRVVTVRLSFILSFIIMCTGVTGCSAKNFGSASRSSSAKIVLDTADKNTFPENFRIASAKYIKTDREKNGKAADITGLTNIDISGSAQFSQRELLFLKKTIHKENIVIVDLRQESHGFVNGNAVSLLGKDDKVNKGQTDAESEKSQEHFLDSIKIGSQLSFSKQPTQSVKCVESVKSEAELVKAAGIKYFRLPVTDKERPSDQTVDIFLKGLKAFPQNSWLHFHCKAGQGRTTTFMSMVDMIHNAKAVSFDDIIYRQYLLGGLDLTDKSTGEDVEGRYSFLKAFYEYCKENNDNFRTTWSKWEKTRTRVDAAAPIK